MDPPAFVSMLHDVREVTSQLFPLPSAAVAVKVIVDPEVIEVWLGVMIKLTTWP